MGIVLVGMERAFSAATDFESMDEVLLGLALLLLVLLLPGGSTYTTLK